MLLLGVRAAKALEHGCKQQTNRLMILPTSNGKLLFVHDWIWTFQGIAEYASTPGQMAARAALYLTPRASMQELAQFKDGVFDVTNA